jgi:hypothetical protein
MIVAGSLHAPGPFGPMARTRTQILASAESGRDERNSGRDRSASDREKSESDRDESPSDRA